MRKFFLSVVSLILIVFGNQATAQTALLVSETFIETLRPTANTGGAWLMGLQVVGLDTDAELQAILPGSWAGKQFCVRTGSSDGLYSSENTYIAPLDTALPIEVPYISHTKYVDQLADMNAESFGIRILGAACGLVTNNTISAIALWRGGTENGMIKVFVNSFDADRLVAFPFLDEIRGTPVECTKISADVSVAFDRTCEISVEAGLEKIELVSIKGGRLGRPEFIEIEIQ